MSVKSILELATTLGVRVRKINVRDPNVFKRMQDSHDQHDPSELAFRKGLRYKYGALGAEIRGNESYLVLELKAALNAGAWSINEPDEITRGRAIGTVVRSTGDIAVFASMDELSTKAREILSKESFRGLVNQLKLKRGESLNFYNNAVVYYALSGGPAGFLERTEAICQFVGQIANDPKSVERTVQFPPAFEDLKDCAEWAISDDTERSEALEKASAQILDSLIRRVGPRLPSINVYLDEHRGEEEALLASLAETVSEALIQRKGK